MESKIIHTSVSICESDTVIVATCEDGSVWTSSNFHSFEPFEKPFKAAQKKVESPETIDNTAMLQLLCDIQNCADESGCYIVDFDTELWYKINNAVVAQQQHS